MTFTSTIEAEELGVFYLLYIKEEEEEEEENIEMQSRKAKAIK